LSLTEQDILLLTKQDELSVTKQEILSLMNQANNKIKKRENLLTAFPLFLFIQKVTY
jgi:Ca2+-binding EF-hand superfamily protein